MFLNSRVSIKLSFNKTFVNLKKSDFELSYSINSLGELGAFITDEF